MIKILFFLLISNFSFANIVVNEANCYKESSSELKIKMKDLPWRQSLGGMESLFNEVYQSGKRLQYRAFKRGSKYILPTKEGKEVVINDSFISNLKIHIESALNRGYADFIFFSDMGHAHLFLDKKLYIEKIKKIPLEDSHLRRELMFKSESTKFLYHTAEQLKMLGEDGLPIKDKKIQWRFFSRNLVAQNLLGQPIEVIYNPKDPHTSVRGRSYDINNEYKYWGAGFDFSASKDGCFEYKHKGQSFYFDISLYAVR